MENSHNPMQLAINSSPRCGAHARTTGQPCRSPAMKNGRCRMHGGRAGRKPIHGRYSQAAKAQRQRARALMRSIEALIATGPNDYAVRAVALADGGGRLKAR